MQIPKARSANVQRLLDNSTKLAKMLSTSPVASRHRWIGFRLTSDGKVEAGKEQNGIHMVAVFEPEGPWAEEAERLKLEEQQHALLASLTDIEQQEYKKLLKYYIMQY